MPEAAVALDAFLASMEAQRVPAGTVAFYRAKLTLLFRLLPPSRESWGPVDVEKAIQNRPEWRSKRSVQAVIQAARRYVRWESDRGMYAKDFTRGIVARGAAPRETVPYTPGQVVALLERARMERHVLEVPIALAAYAGMALHDLRTLTWDEIDLGALELRHARRKTGRGRVLPISPPLAAILAPHAAPDGPVCVGLPGSDTALLRLLKRLQRRAGTPAAGWHACGRHALGTALANAGATVAEVGLALQHAPGSTMSLRYVHASQASLSAAMARAFLRA